MPGVNYHLLWPELLMVILAFGVFGADLVLRPRRRWLLVASSVVGMAGILAFTLAYLWDKDTSLYDGIFQVDNYSLFFNAFFLVLGVAVVLSSVQFVQKHLTHPGEYYGLLLFSIVGMMLMAAAGELLTAYISLELLSFSLYILTSYARDEPKSNEAGVKYVLLGAFSSAILLYGISLVYGAVGATRFEDIAVALAATDGVNPLLMVGIGLIVAGMGFKVAAVPFHMWAPDVYEGAPLPITAYIAVGSKVAAFALLLRLFTEAFLPAIDQWRMLIAIMAVATMTVGNLVALAQTSLKRLLAYSSIAHVGYLLMGIAALSDTSSTGLMLYLVGYAVTNMLLFAAVIAFYNRTGRDEISALAGLHERSPFLAATMTAALFSLSGLPFFAGFIAKFYLFSAVAKADMLWLAGLAILNSLISLYYYLMVIKQIYINPAQEKSRLQVSPELLALIAVLALGVLFVGVYPDPVVDAIEAATRAIFTAVPVVAEP
ncbi:MAG: NADH-quinone oxidoreductase subunit N [Dehalococcoidia bacterium]|nr:NADH-quinone oxidoreductase subunit N [Dehalococcoidia bacterium]